MIGRKEGKFWGWKNHDFLESMNYENKELRIKCGILLTWAGDALLHIIWFESFFLGHDRSCTCLSKFPSSFVRHHSLYHSALLTSATVCQANLWIASLWHCQSAFIGRQDNTAAALPFFFREDLVAIEHGGLEVVFWSWADSRVTGSWPPSHRDTIFAAWFFWVVLSWSWVINRGVVEHRCCLAYLPYVMLTSLPGPKTTCAVDLASFGS